MISETILRYGEPVLREKALKVEKFDDEIRDIIDRMYSILEASGGIGLAAPQVGLSLRLFVYRVGEDEQFHALVNPVIVRRNGEETMIEGCLSIPGLRGEVTRSVRITIAGIDENGEHVRIKSVGLKARMYQHETDHLDGVLFVDKADPDTLETEPVGIYDEEEQII